MGKNLTIASDPVADKDNTSIEQAGTTQGTESGKDSEQGANAESPVSNTKTIHVGNVSCQRSAALTLQGMDHNVLIRSVSLSVIDSLPSQMAGFERSVPQGRPCCESGCSDDTRQSFEGVWNGSFLERGRGQEGNWYIQIFVYYHFGSSQSCHPLANHE